MRTTVPENLQQSYREAIVKFRHWLQESGKSPDAETFKQHLEWKKSYLPSEQFEIRRDALRWYYKEGLRQMKAAESIEKRGLKPCAHCLRGIFRKRIRPALLSHTRGGIWMVKIK